MNIKPKKFYSNKITPVVLPSTFDVVIDFLFINRVNSIAHFWHKIDQFIATLSFSEIKTAIFVFGASAGSLHLSQAPVSGQPIASPLICFFFTVDFL